MPHQGKLPLRSIATAASFALVTSLFSQGVFAAKTREEAREFCQSETKSMNGDAKKASMKTCLAKHAPPSAQGQKMKACSASFKSTGKPSSERRAYMKTCLSNKKAA
jgi:hypothetical protein